MKDMNYVVLEALPTLELIDVYQERRKRYFRKLLSLTD
jgi:hypothetical protein